MKGWIEEWNKVWRNRRMNESKDEWNKGWPSKGGLNRWMDDWLNEEKNGADVSVDADSTSELHDDNNLRVCVGSKHHRLWPLINAFHAEVPRGSGSKFRRINYVRVQTWLKSNIRERTSLYENGRLSKVKHTFMKANSPARMLNHLHESWPTYINANPPIWMPVPENAGPMTNHR